MKKYDIIYADPPWQYRTYSKKGQGRSAESHYPTMGIEDIKALPVGELAAKDCALFMWITFPCLQEALEVLTAWGFSYKTVAFVWVKQNRKSDSLFWGMGYWTRANDELCILAKYLKEIPQFSSELDDAFIEEHGLSVLMQVVRELPPLDTPFVPRDSIVREFVGGSCFQY